MTWTNDKPTKPGWYWWQSAEYNKGIPEICQIIYDNDGKSVQWFYRGFDDETDELDDIPGQWSGPIELPEDTV